MRPFCLLFALVSLVACVEYTAPRDFHCLYPGDTVGVVAIHPNGIITSCTWVIQKVEECRDDIDSHVLFHASDCIVGSKA
jgi:hypothetical protein